MKAPDCERDVVEFQKESRNSCLHAAITDMGSLADLAYDTSLLSWNGIERCFEEVRMQVWSESKNKTTLDLDYLGDACHELSDNQKHNLWSPPAQKLTLDNCSVMSHQCEYLAERTPATYSPIPRSLENECEIEHNEKQGNHQISSVTSSGKSFCQGGQHILRTGAQKEAQQSYRICQGVLDGIADGNCIVEAISLSKDNSNIRNTQPVNHHGLDEHTIHTKEALAEILPMFSEPLPLLHPHLKSMGRCSASSQRMGRYSASSARPVEALPVYVNDGTGFLDGGHMKARSLSNYVDNESKDIRQNNEESRMVMNTGMVGVTEIMGICAAISARPVEALPVYVDNGTGFLDGCHMKARSLTINVDNERKDVRQNNEESRMVMNRGMVKVTEILTKERESSCVSKDVLSEDLHEALNKMQVDDSIAGATTSSIAANPWDDNFVNELLKTLTPPLSEYKGFYSNNQRFNGVNMFSLKTIPHNKTLELGLRRYHLKRCIGQGAFARIFKAYDEKGGNKFVALKIQRPACPWEYYIYSQLDKRMPQEERASFGRASNIHVYADCSIMVCAYGEHGTLQDVVNLYLNIGERMEELLCVYYTIEMLRILETLHSGGLIHGDFKPDNLLIRNEGEILEDWARDRPGYWKEQGLCLIDWGRSIDMSLFPPNTAFMEDCKTSGFRCIEMQQKRPWTYQVDTYGLCCTVHTMLHGTYMEVQGEMDADQIFKFRPKAPFKRYHNRKIWTQLFNTLLNVKSCKDNPSLKSLQRCFEDYLMSNVQFRKNLKNLIARQSTLMCSRR